MELMRQCEHEWFEGQMQMQRQEAEEALRQVRRKGVGLSGGVSG